MALLFPVLCLADPAPIDGYWSGSAERDDIRHEIAVKLTSREGKVTGTFDWPSMGYVRTDLLGVKIDGRDIRMSIPLPLGSIKLVGEVDGERIHGTLDPIGLVKGEWQSLGAGGSFEVRRGREPSPPYKTEEVRFANGNVALTGTLFLPSSGVKHPAIVFVAGSGDATRGEGSFLADRLARSGIAALVYDKRGTGQSTGDWHQGGFEELADDAITALRTLQSRSDIEINRTGFVCQSQGCWVTPIALSRRAPAHFVIAQSAPAVSVAAEDLDYYRVTLRSQGYGEPEIAEAFELITTDQHVSLGKASWTELQHTIARFRERPWFKSLGYEPSPPTAPIRTFDRHILAYDPAADFDAIRIPSLWIYGEADTIIPVRDSLAVVRKAHSQPSPQVIVLPRAGHSFTVSDTAIPQLAQGYPDVVIHWIRDR
ncbi:MAG TPA: alpha/beta hydrolase [Steroidobacteraceae bacterium]|nr:alpha/beta hydrolase [Steroidobacteraceae bacterium]